MGGGNITSDEKKYVPVFRLICYDPKTGHKEFVRELVMEEVKKKKHYEI